MSYNLNTARSLDKNSNWKGGRTVSSHGYILIKQPSHPHADKNGYVYEHRLVMEQIIGRFLEPHEIVHHKNESKKDNSPENLVLEDSIASHKLEHRIRKDRRKPGEGNPIIKCACGCDGVLMKYDKHNRPRRFITGHSRKGKLSYDPKELIKCACGCGQTITKYDKYARERKFISGHNSNINNPNRRVS
jgi:hypothetical protein